MWTLNTHNWWWFFYVNNLFFHNKNKEKNKNFLFVSNKSQPKSEFVVIYCLVDSIVAGFQRWVNVLITFRALNFSYVIIVVVATCGNFSVVFFPRRLRAFTNFSDLLRNTKKWSHLQLLHRPVDCSLCSHKNLQLPIAFLSESIPVRNFNIFGFRFLFNRNFSLSLAVRWNRWLERGEIRGISCWTTWAWFSLHPNYRCRLYNSHFFHWKSPWRNIKCSKLKCTAATVLCGSREH